MPIALVTGATGCLGQAVCSDLVAQGWQVRSLSRHASAPDAMVQRHFVSDLSRDAIPADALAGADVVLHCAALSSAWGREQEFFAANVTATQRMLQEAQGAGVRRFVHVSTPSIYITGRSRLHVHETARLPGVFVNDYARSKYLAEQMVRAANAPEFVTVVLRPRAIYGPHDRSLLPRLMSRLEGAASGPLPLPGGGLALIDPTHVTDAARAMRLAALAPADKAGGQVYNITSGQAVTLNDVLDLLEKLLGLRVPRLPVPYAVAMAAARVMEATQRIRDPGHEPTLTRHMVAALGLSLTLDIRAARQDLGYKPQVTLKQGLTLLAKDRASPRLAARAACSAPRLNMVQVGSCLAAGTALRGDHAPLPRKVPVLVAAITHKVDGLVLFDAGHDCGDATKPPGLPELAFRIAVPTWLPRAENLPDALQRTGLTDPQRIILSHLHADHVAGLFALDRIPKVLASRVALTQLAELVKQVPGTAPGMRTRFGAVAGGLPLSLAMRLQSLVDAGVITCIERTQTGPLPGQLSELGAGHDILGDGSMMSVPLPGHGTGQTGLWLPRSSRGPVILAADAAFSVAALRADALPPMPLLAQLGEVTSYRKTFAILRQMISQGVTVIPTHDPDIRAV